MMRMKLTAVTLGLALAACGSDGPDGGDTQCTFKCDDIGDQLDGREDPIARWLRNSAISEDGVLRADFGTVVEGVAEEQGCSLDTWRTFIVSDPLVVKDEAFPRLVSTVCNSDTQASEFFIAASFRQDGTDDVSIHELEMFAWDKETEEYRFYAASPTNDQGDVKLEVDPERCRNCHLTPHGLSSDGMPMTPIMNELTQPWSHWNSQVPLFNPDDIPFRSHEFSIPDATRRAPNFAMFGAGRAAQAQILEQTIRAGHARVAQVRSNNRRQQAADFRPAMDLMRPLFCEEQLQYATEDFSTGLIGVTSLIPGGIREAYSALSERRGSWPWLNSQDGRIRLAAPENEAPVFMFPIRGNADIDYENRLLQRRAFTPEEIMQVRALDWKRPTLSKFRCDLWRTARARFEVEAPSFTPNTRNSAIMKELLPQILVIGDSQTPIRAADGQFVALDRATPDAIAALEAALADSTLSDDCGAGSCIVGVESFGDMLDAYVTGWTELPADEARVQLLKMRDELLCDIGPFEAKPALPEFECPDAPVDPNPGEEPGVLTSVNNTATRILDQQVTASSISAADEVEVTSVEIKVNITHDWRGDVAIRLRTPAGDDEHDVVDFPLNDGEKKIAGRFEVAGLLGQTIPPGDWVLIVEDRQERDTGTLVSWSLGVNAPAP